MCDYLLMNLALLAQVTWASFRSQSVNGIKIQIWCILIPFLRLEIIHLKVAKKVAFSVMITDLSILVMTYIDFISFLNDPDKAKSYLKNQEKAPSKAPPIRQPRLPFDDLQL